MPQAAVLGFVVGLQAEARIVRRLGRVAVGGGTAEGAARAAAALIACGAEALISFGLAGGLDPALRPGDTAIPAAVLAGDERLTASPTLTRILGGPSITLLLASEAVIAAGADKRAAYLATDAQAVDMESGAVALAARTAGLPWAVLRVICDPAERDLPPAALVALSSAGAIGLLRVLRSVATDPGQLPSLLALAVDAARARRSLRRAGARLSAR